MAEDFRIDRESAERDFNRFVELMDLDLSPDGMDENDKDDLAKHKRVIIRSIMRGSLTVDDNGEIDYVPHRTDGIEKLHFYEPEGSFMVEMDRRKAGHDISKVHALIGAMTKTSIQTVNRLKGTDYKVAQAVVLLFLG